MSDRNERKWLRPLPTPAGNGNLRERLFDLRHHAKLPRTTRGTLSRVSLDPLGKILVVALTYHISWRNSHFGFLSLVGDKEHRR
jgi:hypothetical protein